MASECIQIGGSFTQTDIRTDEDYAGYTLLLLQIDSSGTCEGGVMWGGMGTGNFFATEARLKGLDFTRCLMTGTVDRKPELRRSGSQSMIDTGLNTLFFTNRPAGRITLW